jgi:hypothetical protein
VRLERISVRAKRGGQKKPWEGEGGAGSATGRSDGTSRMDDRTSGSARALRPSTMPTPKPAGIPSSWRVPRTKLSTRQYSSAFFLFLIVTLRILEGAGGGDYRIRDCRSSGCIRNLESVSEGGVRALTRNCEL